MFSSPVVRNARPSPTGAIPFLSIRQGRPHVFLAMALALPTCGGGKSGQPPMREAEEGIVTLTALPVTTTVELTGRTNATKIAEVRLQVDGFIKARLFAPDSNSIRSISVPTEPHATRAPRNWQTLRAPPRGRRRRASIRASPASSPRSAVRSLRRGRWSPRARATRWRRCPSSTRSMPTSSSSFAMLDLRASLARAIDCRNQTPRPTSPAPKS